MKENKTSVIAPEQHWPQRGLFVMADPVTAENSDRSYSQICMLKVILLKLGTRHGRQRPRGLTQVSSAGVLGAPCNR